MMMAASRTWLPQGSGLGPSGRLGTARRDDGVWEAVCWAPRAEAIAVVLTAGDRFELEPLDGGYFGGEIGEHAGGERYWLELDRELRSPEWTSFRMLPIMKKTDILGENH